MAGSFYVAVVQAVLLFRSETWFLTPRLEKYLERFRHRAARRMAVMGPKGLLYGTWVYLPIGGGAGDGGTGGDHGVYRPPP